MRSARVIAVGLGILCSASLPAFSAPAEQASELLVAPPELPQPVAELGSGPGATADATISPPDLPDAAVVFTPADRLRAAICGEARADPGHRAAPAAP